MTPDDFEKLDVEALKWAYSEADKRLATQLQLALASDARSNGLVAASAALAAAGVAVLGEQLKDGKYGPLFWAALIFTLIEVGAAWCAVRALRPQAFKVVGWSPDKLVEDARTGVAFKTILAQSLVFLQGRIDGNRATAKTSAGWTTRAMYLVVAGPLVGAVAGLAAAMFIGHRASPRPEPHTIVKVARTPTPAPLELSGAPPLRRVLKPRELCDCYHKQ